MMERTSREEEEEEERRGECGIRNGKERERRRRHEEDNTRMDSSTLTVCILVTFPTSHAERSPWNCSAYKTLMRGEDIGRGGGGEERRV